MGNPTFLAVFLAAVFLTGIPAAPATIYVVMENGVEVGRYEETDGSGEVKTVDHFPSRAPDNRTGRFEKNPEKSAEVSEIIPESLPRGGFENSESRRKPGLNPDWILVCIFLVLTLLVKYLFDKKPGKGND